jgi:putative PIN family toxin of toxin-antitoxin system
LDTNVLASGIVGIQRPDSAPGALVRLWRAGELSLVTSEPTLTELANTLAEPYFRRQITSEQVTRVLELLRETAMLAPSTATIRGAASHPEDEMVLATAVSGAAQYLVTGDAQLQRLGAFRGVVILSPRAFLNLLLDQEPQSS